MGSKKEVVEKFFGLGRKRMGWGCKKGWESEENCKKLEKIAELWWALDLVLYLLSDALFL